MLIVFDIDGSLKEQLANAFPAANILLHIHRFYRPITGSHSEYEKVIKIASSFFPP